MLANSNSCFTSGARTPRGIDIAADHDKLDSNDGERLQDIDIANPEHQYRHKKLGKF